MIFDEQLGQTRLAEIGESTITDKHPPKQKSTTYQYRDIYFNMTTPITRLDIVMRIKELRDELEARCKTGMVKMASSDGKPIPTKQLQDEMFSLIYRKSCLDKLDD